MLSAIGGLEVLNPDLAVAVVPITIAILLLLFGLQRFGTAKGTLPFSAARARACAS